MISASDRENAVLLINEAIASGASCKKACYRLGITERTFYRWKKENQIYHHSGLKFLTPYQRRSGLSDKILAKRKEVYEAAKTEHPERWNGRSTRDWSLPDTVYLNPEKISEEAETAVEETAVS